MRNVNSVLRRASEEVYDRSVDYVPATLAGVGLKTIYFVILTIIGGGIGIFLINNFPASFVYMAISSFIIGFITAIIAMRSVRLAFPLGSIYCIVEGMFLGVVSLYLEQYAPGIVITAILSTIAIVLACGVVFITGLVKVNNKFRRFLALFAISFLITGLFIPILMIFGVIASDNYLLIIGVGFVTLLLACLFLINDFSYAYELVRNNEPKELEWMVAFGIAYTVVWLYYEVLRLLYLIFGRRN